MVCYVASIILLISNRFAPHDKAKYFSLFGSGTLCLDYLIDSTETLKTAIKP